MLPHNQVCSHQRSVPRMIATGMGIEYPRWWKLAGHLPWWSVVYKTYCLQDRWTIYKTCDRICMICLQTFYCTWRSTAMMNALFCWPCPMCGKSIRNVSFIFHIDIVSILLYCPIFQWSAIGSSFVFLHSVDVLPYSTVPTVVPTLCCTVLAFSVHSWSIERGIGLSICIPMYCT